MISIKNLVFSYEKDKKILEDISLDIEDGESVGVVGANGVGKSTLLKLLVGLDLDFGGSINYDNIVLSKKTLPEIRKNTGYVFQDSDSQLFMNTVYEDVAFAPRNYGLSKEEIEERVENALSLCKIEHLRDKQIYKMSGGEKKLASIAAVLSMEPKTILMDEPSVALDPKNRRNLINILNSFEMTKVIASHDLDFILDTCEKTVLMADGKIIAAGPTKEILSNEQLLEENGMELPLSMYKK